MVEGTAATAVVGVAGAAAVEAVAEGTAAGAGGVEPEQAVRATSRGIALRDIRRFLTSS